jgi:LuxR family maltose regulon positive regulatory protein
LALREPGGGPARAADVAEGVIREMEAGRGPHRTARGDSAAPPKLSRPHIRDAWLRRERLNAMVDAGVRHLVTLVSAGPGWGKTALVSAWAATHPHPVAWLTLDSQDDDSDVFWPNVLTALRSARAVPEVWSSGELTALPDGDADRVRVLRRAFGRARTPALLVLDDLHFADGSRVAAELGQLLLGSEGSLRFVVISRSEPDLPLHRLRALGEVSEIRTHDLAFTADEAAALLAGQGVQLSPADISLLLLRVEGWPTGVQLAAGFLAGPERRSVADFAGDVRFVEDYLSKEVLARQPPDLRRFLLYTSICENVCGDLGDAITRETTGQRTLEALEQVNQFVVRLGPRPFWFRYHHLMRDALQHRLLLETPEELPRLHRRAADWYARHSFLLEALGHAIDAKDWAYVGRLVVEAAPIVLSPDRLRLVKVLERVPAERLSDSPELVVCAAMQLFNAADYAGIRERLSQAQDLLKGTAEADRRQTDIVIRALRVTVNRADGDMPAVVDDATVQLTSLAKAPPARLPSALQYRAVALNNKGVGLLWTGRTEAAVRYLGIASSAASTAGLDLVEINALGHQALLEVMSGSVREAERLVRLARDLAGRRGLLNVLQAVPAHLAAALVHLERHHLEAAERALQQGLRAHLRDPEAAQWKLYLGIHARLATAQGDLTGARAFLEEALGGERYPYSRTAGLDRWLLTAESELDLASGRPDLVERRYGRTRRSVSNLPERNLLARAALATRDLAAAQALLTPQGSLMVEAVATVEARILTAMVAEAAGLGAAATSALGQAIALAVREGVYRPFLALAGELLDSLLARQSLLTGEHAPFVADLMQLGGVVSRPGGSPAAVPLSDRETEVLRYLPTMLTAAEIGAELGVSVNTVKAHMRAIYRKLGVSRRREAVVRARAYGILWVVGGRDDEL